MPTIMIHLPDRIIKKDIRISLDELDDETAVLLLSLVLENILRPREEEIKAFAEMVEAEAWKKAKRGL